MMTVDEVVVRRKQSATSLAKITLLTTTMLMGVANFALSSTPPTVVTQAATAVAPFGATLNGTVNPNGTVTTAFFEYGLTSAYGQPVAATSSGSGLSPVAVSWTIFSGLSCNMLYHFRLVATNSGGTSYGDDNTFMTPPCPMITSDFNNDGHPDVLWQNDATRQVAIWYMGSTNGNIELGASFLGAAGAAGVPGWSVVGTGDFDNDGHPDVVWQRDATRQVAVWYMGGAQGDVLLGASFLGAAGAVGAPGWSVVSIRDFNNDGHPDIMWQQDATRQVAVWYMGGAQGDVLLSASFLGAAGAAGVPRWRVAGIVDLNYDGRPDIVWQEDATARVFVWYMNGAQGHDIWYSSYLGNDGAVGVPGWRVIAR